MFEWSLTEQVLLGILAVVWLYQLYFYLRYMLAAARAARPAKEQPSADVRPGVSVIVCARNEHANLCDYLQALLTQDYPQYEVIVVDDGSEDDTRLMVERWQKRYTNLKLTFVPIGAHVMSTKKLAITLGAKAAQYDYLLLTDADCRPESTHWIATMVTGFMQPGGQIDIVLGAGMYFVKPGLLNRMIQFDTLFNAMQYLGMSQCGHPYMGVGRNLAYSKRLFFAQHGFAGILEHRAGDDDLFVNRVATKQNTAVVCTRESLTWSVPKASLGEWLRQKRRHLSVAPAYRTATKVRLTLEPFSRGMLYALAIALLVLASWEIRLGVVAALLIRWVVQVLIINTAASRWGTTKVILLLPLWEVLLPLINLVTLLIEPLRPKPKRW